MSQQFETLNMRTASITRILKQIKQQLEDEDYTPVSIIGKSGIGKTESIMSLAKELGVGFKELRLSHYQESDLVGLPYIDSDGKTKHAATNLLPDSNDTNQGILLLDEVTSSQKSMRSAVYQLMDSSRKLGEYVMPSRWLIVACGNGPDDGGDFRGIEAAFMSRGFCWRAEASVEDWKQWALQAGVHPTVIAFLSFRPDYLHKMDLDKPYDMIACPRNWVKLSTQLFNMEKRSPNGIITDDEDLEFSSDGCVGATCGPSFSAFYRYNKEVINASDIMEGKVSISQLKSATDEVLYITAQNLVKLIKDTIKNNKVEGNESGVNQKCLQQVSNVFNWIIDVSQQIRLDLGVAMLNDLASACGRDFITLVMSDEFDISCPRFLAFCTENSIVFGGA